MESSSSLYKNIFLNSPIAKILINRERNITYVNNLATELFGYSRTELLVAKIELLLPEQFTDNHPQFVQSYFNNPISRRMGVGRDLLGKKKNGSTFPVEVALTTFEENNEQLIMASIIDITERMKAEEKFRNAVEAAPNWYDNG